MPVLTDNLDDVFDYHAPTEEDRVRYQALRASAKSFASAILSHTPRCADQQASLRLVREALMTANAAIATKGAV